MVYSGKFTDKMNGARLFIRLVMEGVIQKKLSYVNDSLNSLLYTDEVA